MILLNNQLIEREQASIDIEDRGYQFGDGVYEVIRVYNGKLMYMAEHLKRLKRSTAAIHIVPTMSDEELAEKLIELVQVNNVQNGIVYMQVTRGVAPRNHAFPKSSSSVLTAYTKPLERPMDMMNNGVSTHSIEDFRWLRCDIKSLNLLGNVLAKQEALEHGCQEAIFHRGDKITEGGSSNIFIVESNVLITHPADNLILNGIIRQKVIDLAIDLGLPIIERVFTFDELLNADEAFLTSTTQEVMPIIKVDDTLIANGQPGSWTKRLQEAFHLEIERICGD